jgi:hypothetical protein
VAGVVRVAPVPITMVSANVGPTQPLPANGHIELGFDRLLQPTSYTRQTFVLTNAAGNIAYTPTIAYDPVARIVTLTPLSDPKQKLVSGQSYEVVILAPENAGDMNGLRAIDGATLRHSPQRIAFSVIDPTPAPPPVVRIDFCRDIFPITSVKCSLPMCHGGAAPAAGLLLDPPRGIPETAVGRVAQGSNTGPRAVASPPTLLFGEDMPIIDATGNTNGNPGDSWLLYKLLLSMPSPEPVNAPANEAGTGEAGGEDGGSDATVGAPDSGAIEAGATDGGAPADGGSPAEAGATEAGAGEGGVPTPVVIPPADVSGVHSPLTWEGIPLAERATLSNYILGREMPFPPTPVMLNPTNNPLTLQEMERMSLWIAQGASAPASCP